MLSRKWFVRCLYLFVGVLLIANLLPYRPVSAQSSGVRAPYRGMWLTEQELANLPTSGAAWNALVDAANQSGGSPNLEDQNSDNDIYVLAKALVYARTGESRYRGEVVSALQQVMETENGGRTLALGRNLVSYVIAADLINLPQDGSVDGAFRAWLRGVVNEPLDGRTLINTHEERPNNWGTHAGASRVAVSLYMGDTADVARAADVFHGWLGNRSVYSDFQYGELDWQCSESAPVGINPRGCTKNGVNIDGAQPEEMRRGGEFRNPPDYTGYAWEALQGAIVQAMLLDRAGYPVFEWQDRALLRAYQYVYRIGWEPEGDDEWQVWLVNYAYGANYATCSAGRGKNMAWTDWTHQMRSRAAFQADVAPQLVGNNRIFLPVISKPVPPPKRGGGC